MEDLLPSRLEVRESAAYGRGLFTRSTLSPGTEVLTSLPFAHVVSAASRGAVCDSCLLSTGSLLKCSQCKFIYYCGKICQKKDWPLHKVECKSLVAIQPHSPSDTMRLVIRVLQRKKRRLKKKRSGEASSEVTSTLYGGEIDYLCSNMGSLSVEVKGELAVQMAGISKLMEADQDYVAEDAFEVLCKVLRNTFYILDWSMNAVAAGLYLTPSLINHSCDPNCVVVYDGLQLSLKPIKLVKQGEQLFISYTELLETKEKRRSHLNRVYSFRCCCSRCHGEDERATGLLAATREDIPASVAEGSVREGLAKIDDEVNKMKKAKDWQGVADVCNRLLSHYTSVLNPLNIVMIKLQQEMLEAELELEKWTAALATAEQLLKHYQHHLPKYHPCVAVHLIKIAKLRRVIATTKHLELSIGDLSLAMEMLLVSHGISHPLSNEVQTLLHDSQGELVRRRSSVS